MQLSYAIGVAEPLSIFVDSYGSVKEGKTDADLTKLIRANFDLRPGAIVKGERTHSNQTEQADTDYPPTRSPAELGLQKPIYGPTASYGHL